MSSHPQNFSTDEYVASHHEGSDDAASRLADSHGDYSAGNPDHDDHMEESRGNNHVEDPHTAYEMEELQTSEPLEDFENAYHARHSRIPYHCVEGAYAYLIEAAQDMGLDYDKTTVFVAIHHMLQEYTSVELCESEQRPGVREGLVCTPFGVDLHLETEDLATFDVSLNDRVLFGKLVDAVREHGYRAWFSHGVIYGYIQECSGDRNGSSDLM